tara:strand:+ start:376 stop:1236 length:861 start_codon:yes stop_codon:yes gene_type:complete
MSFRPELIINNDHIILKKFDSSIFPESKNISNDDKARMICFLDLETTGLNSNKDQIVEIAIKLVSINEIDGQLLGVVDSYESFNDPKIVMDEKNIAIHGITNEMVLGQFIDWDRVKNIFEKSDIVVAHNARFDRSFMDKYFPLSEEKVWACSVNDIDWAGLGFNSRSQELLCIWHGFYYESHRAMTDVDALIHLVTNDSYVDEKPIKQLIANAFQLGYKILALNSSIKLKDDLRNNGYYWNSDNKYWWKIIKENDLEPEKDWLSTNIYNGSFLGQVELVTPADRYK